MSDTGKQSPLGINVLGALLQNQGLWINPKVSGLVGSSKTNDSYEPGDIINNTCLYWLTYAINDGYHRGEPGYDPLLLKPPTLTNSTYENLINIGQSRIPALGNSAPPTYIAEDPSGVWNGEATSGYGESGDTGQGQSATWYPFVTSNPNIGASQWGWLRLIALQAWNEFNYNGETASQAIPNYQYFVQSFLSAQGFVDNSNKALYSIQDSKKFLQGVYSNMDDLTSSDITGVSLASRAFGQDLLNLGKALDLSTISTFGLPSNLLKTLKKSNTITQNLSYALLGANLTSNEISSILSGEVVTLAQEQAIYGAFGIITDDNLIEILTALNCKTKGLTALTDLLSIKKLFPISYPSLTVPIYNTAPGPTNSKTYYLLFVNGQLNPQLVAPAVAEQITPIVPVPPVDEPPIIIPPEPAVTVEQVIAETPITPQQGGGGGGGGGCVALESFIPLVETIKTHNGKPITYAWQLEPDMTISLGTEELEIKNGKVVKALNDYQPCVRIETADGIALVCSTTAPILTKENGFVLAPELFGKRVAVMRNNVTYFDEVVNVEDVGMRFVRVIDTGNNSFWAGSTPDGYILHHNVMINDQFGTQKF